MKAIFSPCTLNGCIKAPPSKSMTHRYLISAALSEGESVISGVSFSEDILATIDCLKALGAEIQIENDNVSIRPDGFMKSGFSTLNCRESGSTLRFFLPLALCPGQEITLTGSKRLFERPLGIYEELCREKGFEFIKGTDSVKVCGKLEEGEYKVPGNISSQFVTGLIFALVFINKASSIHIIPPFESSSYVKMTVSVLKQFGCDIGFENEYTIRINPSHLHSRSETVEGDYSNAAFLDGFNYIGSDVTVTNLNPYSLQGDRIYKEYFRQISDGSPVLDISDCPDLGPVLIALASLKNGATLTGTDRLKIKESDRGKAMHEELTKLGGGLVFTEGSITVPPLAVPQKSTLLNGHNDHRIVMALSLIMSEYGGAIEGAEAVKKSYPDFFTDIKKLNAEVITE